MQTSSYNYQQASHDLGEGMTGGLNDYLNQPQISQQNSLCFDNEKNQQIQNQLQSPQKAMQSHRAYLDVALKQKLKGYWDPNDVELWKIIFKDEKFPEIPQEVQEKTNITTNEVWITLLVLLWLESICQTDRKAWSSVHQKGCEWLKEQGVEYENVKIIVIPIVT